VADKLKFHTQLNDFAASNVRHARQNQEVTLMQRKRESRGDRLTPWLASA
jgi:hypothetical protein